MTDALPHLAALSESELLALLHRRDPSATAADARRLLASHFGRPDVPGETPRPVRRNLRQACAELTRRDTLQVVDRTTDPSDGFVKYLLRSPDGALHEAVRIPLLAQGCFSVCLSSQVGCAMGCTFCATGRLGLQRHLQAWEIVEAFRLVRAEAPGRVSGAVFMGQGEPFHNYDEVMRAAQAIAQPYTGRIAAAAISISTVGLVPQMLRFAAEKRPYRLVVSLTSALEAKRAELLPITKKHGLAELAAALRTVHAATGQRLTVAWVVMAGVNTGSEEVQALQQFLGDLPVRVNLIDVNDARENGYARAEPAELEAFRDRLQVLGQPIVRRYSGGQQRQAACGMLAATRWHEQAAGEQVSST
ncbi:MAG: radical SAM protein [Deltaproteobacteria bacterium]|nr:radical SAM protein [Deltaproteobacteria bacterium]